MKQMTMQGVLVATFAAIGFFLFGQSDDGKGISVEDAQRMIERDSSVVVLDVRTQAEFAGELGHIRSAVLIPVQELEQHIAELDTSKTILAVCRTGRRSARATELLSQRGFTVLNVQGGMVEWNAMQLPVAKESDD
ncbi:MAG: rhodanese-like domain-containing protein [Ignavibacteriae bacterium]|nr:rhodanese-like domain-containing protein [Ignavibacteriota bacterium]